jgi:glutamate synthase (NADPH/NADH)
MAKLGIRKFQDLIGRTEFLKPRSDLGYKERTIDLSRILVPSSELRTDVSILGGTVRQDFELEKRMDQALIDQCKPVLVDGQAGPVNVEMEIPNSCRAFATTLSYHVAK